MDSALVERIRAVLKELAAIRVELGAPAIDPATGLATPKISSEQLRAFKREIDQTRLFLWAHIGTLESTSTNVSNSLARLRLEAATEILRQLRQDFCFTGVPPTKEGRRLSSLIRAVTPLLPE